MLTTESFEMNLFHLETTAEFQNRKEFNRIKKQNYQVEPKLGCPERVIGLERELGLQLYRVFWVIWDFYSKCNGRDHRV